MDVRQAEIHVIAFDGAGYATDEDHRAIRLLSLDDSDVRQRVVCLAISVEVPRVVEEDEVAGVGGWSLVERAVLPYVGMDEADAICLRIARAAAVQIDPVFEKHCTGYARAVIGDAAAVALNRFGAYECGRCLHDRVPGRRTLDGSTTGALCR